MAAPAIIASSPGLCSAAPDKLDQPISYTAEHEFYKAFLPCAHLAVKNAPCKRLVVIRKFTKQPIDRARQRKSVMDQKSMTDFLYASLFKICDGENKE